MSGISSFVSGLGNIEMYSIQLAFAYWMDVKIDFSKINYRVYTDTIKEILNMALSGKIAVQWRSEKEIKGTPLMSEILLQRKNWWFL